MAPDVAPPAERPRAWRVLAGPAAGALVLLAGPGDSFAAAAMAGITTWMAVWWVLESVAVPVTSLLPLVLLPLCGIETVDVVARDYGRETIFLFLGGFLLALGLQTSGAHERIALAVVAAIGSRPRRLVLGFLLAAGALSMWLSNTSAALLLLPIALSVLGTAREQGTPEEDVRRLAVPLMLAVAHGATIGGLATPVGTPTNLVFRQLFPQLFPGAPEPGFLQWMLLGVPLAALYLGIGWWLMVRVVFPLPDAELLGGRDALGALRRALGPVRRDELVTGALFAVTALLWVTGKGFRLGDLTIPGWQALPGLDGRVDDHVVAIAMAGLLFVLPSRDRPSERLLEWRHAHEVPWGVLLLFGGGFALATGFGASGLSEWAAGLFLELKGAPAPLVLLVTCASLVVLSEFASNTATAQIALPILSTAAVGLAVDPRLLLIPATLSASCAFMMPVGTPPASIVYASGHLRVRDMVRLGIWFNLLGLVLVIGLTWLLAGPVFGISFEGLPSWAAP